MINLFVNYYRTADPERQKEISFCLEKNSLNPLINRIIIFSDLWVIDDALGIEKRRLAGTHEEIATHIHPKQEVVPIDRPTYQDFFDTASDYPDDINIIANSDIYFDETIKLVEGMGDNDAYCLTRWEYNKGDIQPFFRIHGAPPCWSQDCVIWKGVNRLKNAGEVWATNLQTNQDELIPYTLGWPGQENHMAWLLKNAGYNVKNPSLSIKAIHVHKERSRPQYKYRIKGQKGGGTWGRLAKVEQIAL